MQMGQGARSMEQEGEMTAKTCASVEYAILDDVRGTRFCEYEEREDGEPQDD